MMDIIWGVLLLAALAGLSVNVIGIMEEVLEDERED